MAQPVPSFASLAAPRNFRPAPAPSPAASLVAKTRPPVDAATRARLLTPPTRAELNSPDPKVRADAQLRASVAAQPGLHAQVLTGRLTATADADGYLTPIKPSGFGGYLDSQLGKAAADIKNIPGGVKHILTQNPEKSARELGKGIIDTILHPGRDLFQTGTLGLAGAGTIGGILGRATAVGDVVSGAGATDLTSAIGRLPKADKRVYAVLKDPKTHLPKIDRPTYNRIVSPSPQMLDVIKHAPEVAVSRTAVLERLSKLREEGQKPAPAGVGSAVRAVGASKPAQVAKAALKTPLPKTRTLTVPGAEGEAAVTVQRLGSKNAAANLVQRKVIDAFRQHNLNKGGGEPVSFVPGFQKATDKLAGQFSAQNTVGRELRASRRVIDSLELAPASRLERFGRTTPSAVAKTLTGGRVAGPSIRAKLPGDRLSAAEQKAAQIVATGVTPAEHIAAHQNKLAAGVGKAADHRIQIALTRAAVPHINSPTPKLINAINETRAVIASRQKLLGMTPDEIAHPIGAKASDIEAQAKGVESPLQELARLEALDAELARYGEGKHATEVAATQKLLDRVLKAQAGKAAPLSGPEVDALHEQITSHLDDLQTAVETHGAAGATDLLPKTRIFVASPGKAAAVVPVTGGTVQPLLGKFGNMGVVKARPSQVTIVEHPIGEASQMLASLRDAASRLEGARSPYPHLTAQESLLRTRLDQLTSGVRGTRAKFLAGTAAVRTARIADIHAGFIRRGNLALEEGAFYLPSKSLRDLRSGGPVGKVPSVFGLGPGKTRAQIVGPEYTGALQRTGNFRTDATGLAGDSYRQAQRWATIERGFNEVYAMAKDSRAEAGGIFATPIRADAKIPPELKKLFRTTDRGDLTKGDLAHFDQQSVEDWARTLFPDPGQETGKWIDRRYLGALKGDAKNYPDLLKGLDVVNAPFRASLLYTKPAYALNLLQAIGTNAVQQGAFTPVNLYRALTLGRKLGSEDQHAVFSLVGSGLSRSYEAEAGLGKATINKAGEFWNTVADRYPRVASFLHEARREGFNDKTTLHQLLTDERLRPKLVEITRRANQEAIDYGNLTPFERAIVKRAIFFYPWLRGSTLYSLRFLREHPIQAAVGAQVGGEGYDIAKKAFGRILSYTEGIIPAGGGKVVNLRSINTPSTPVELGQAVGGLLHGRSVHAGDLAQQLGPVGLALNALISGKTSLGRNIPHGQSRLGGAAQELLGLVPPLTLARGVPTSKSSNPAKQALYPHDFRTRLGSFFAGGAFRRRLNLPAYRAKSEAEYVSTLTPEEKIGHKYGKLVGQATLDAKRLHAEGFLESAELPPQVARGLKFEQARESAYLAAAKKLGAKLNTVQKAAASIDVLKQAGAIDAATATRVLRVISAESDPARRKELLKLAWKSYGGGDMLTAWRTLVNHHPVGR